MTLQSVLPLTQNIHDMTWSMSSLCKPLLPGWILHADSRIAHLPTLGSTTPQSAGHPSQASERCRLPGYKEPHECKSTHCFLHIHRVCLWKKSAELNTAPQCGRFTLWVHSYQTRNKPFAYWPSAQATLSTRPWTHEDRAFLSLAQGQENICWMHGIQR